MVMLGLARSTMTDSLMLSLEGHGQRVAPVGSVRYLHRSPPGGRGGSDLYSSELSTVGHWHHMVAVYDDGAMRLYVNGKLNELAGAAVPTLENDAQALLLGRLRTDETDPRALVGRLDEVAIYARALSEAEVRQHFELAKRAPNGTIRTKEVTEEDALPRPSDNIP